MSTELERLLQEHAARLEDQMPSITPQEAIGCPNAVLSGPAAAAASRRWGRRWSVVAAAVITIVGAGVLLVRLGGDGARVVTPAATEVPQTGAPTSDRSTIEPSMTAPLAVSSSEPETTTSTTTTAVPEPEITVEQVQLAQRDALRNLTGFSATVSTADGGVSGDTAEPELVTYTLLADGSLYVSTGAGTFGSYDPVTGSVLGAFRDESGELTYQEITGQTDNGLPLTILGGFDPTRLIENQGEGKQRISEIDFERRPAWEVTTIQEFAADDFAFGDEPSPYEADFTQTTVQIIDQESGLILRTSETSTDPSSRDRMTVLSDVKVVDTMPPEFPGSFPDGVEVDRSGNTPRVAGATVEDVVDLFGTAVPIPVGLIEGTATGGGSPPEIAVLDRPQFDEGDDPEGEPRTTYREARFTVREGFIATTVTVSSVALRPSADIPGGLAVFDGYLCFDTDSDLVCDSGGDVQQFTDGSNLITISGGVLADQTAEINPPASALISASTYDGPFAISVYQTDLGTARSILGSFETVTPPN